MPNFNIKLLQLYPEYTTIYGPYTRKDGRKHVFLRDKISRKHTTISYPKALVEVREERKLNANETVDHNDQDFTNDNLDNLVIRTRVEHTKLDVRRVKLPMLPCVWCDKLMQLTNSQFRTTKAGPFCSRKCSGKYGIAIQKGKTKLKVPKHKHEYYTLKGDVAK